LDLSFTISFLFHIYNNQLKLNATAPTTTAPIKLPCSLYPALVVVFDALAGEADVVADVDEADEAAEIH
jgi:hypothetical protein